MRPLNISPSQAKDYYYESDPMFPVGGDSAYPQSQWHGEVSRKFEIQGQTVKQKDFINIISGNDLKGKQIIFTGKDNDGNDHHRAAIDIPFSAPKSVSLCALHLGDHQLVGAHQQAIMDTIKYIEENYVYVRYTTDKTRPGQSQSGLFATFMHSTSRANDPQLHSHTLLMNMSFSPYVNDWRATWNDKIFADQKHLTMVYQNALAQHVYELGYDIEKRPNGFWEIAGVKQEWIDQFSKRSQEIDEREEELKGRLNTENGSVLRNAAVLDSRDDKDTKITQAELKQSWEDQVPQSVIKDSIKDIKYKTKNKNTVTPIEYLRIAYQTINQNESTFKKFDVIDTAISLSIGEYSPEQYEKSFNDMMRQNEIIKLEEIENDRGLINETFTSSSILQAETNIISEFQKGLFSSDPYLDISTTKRYIHANYAYLTDGQKKALLEIFTSRDQFVLIQGDAGTGKTTLLKALKEINDHEKLNILIRGLGFTGKAADELEKKSGIKSQTLSSFLIGQDSKTSLYIVDESSMVGSYQMLELINRAKDTDSKIIFIGDGKQLQAISAGKMFKVLTKDHLKTVLMEQAIRQKTAYMKDTVHHIKSFQSGNDKSGIDKAFDILKENDRIKEIKDRTARINRVVQDYLSEKNYYNNLIVTPKNDDRKRINDIIIKQAMSNDRTNKKKITTEIRLPVNVMGEGKLHAVSYKIDQNAFINSTNVQTCVKAGTPLTVIKVSKKSLTFEYNGKEFNLKLGDARSKINAFVKIDSSRADMFVDSQLVYLKTQSNEGVFKVDSIDIDQNSIVLSRGKQILTIDLNLSGRGLEIYKQHQIQPENESTNIKYIAGSNIPLSHKLSSGKEIVITGTDEVLNTIDVNYGGAHHTLDLSKVGENISVYEREVREFAVGDKIVFLKNDQRQDIQNGLTAIIEDIDHQGNIRAKVNEDRYVYFKTSKYQYFDHGYAVTLHKSQGQDTDKVFIVADTEYKGMNNTELFYVGVSRGKEDAYLYVDNESLFKDQVKTEQGKTSTLDHLKHMKSGSDKGKQHE